MAENVISLKTKIYVETQRARNLHANGQLREDNLVIDNLHKGYIAFVTGITPSNYSADNYVHTWAGLSGNVNNDTYSCVIIHNLPSIASFINLTVVYIKS